MLSGNGAEILKPQNPPGDTPPIVPSTGDHILEHMSLWELFVFIQSQQHFQACPPVPWLLNSLNVLS